MRVRDLTRAVLAAGAFGLGCGAAAAGDQPVMAAPPAAALAAGPVVSAAPGGCASCEAATTGSCASCNRAKSASLLRFGPYKRPVYPFSEKKYDQAYAHPTIAPGTCFGYFKPQWSSWSETCPGWPVDPVAQSIYAPRTPSPVQQPAPAAPAPAPNGTTPPKDAGTPPPAAPMPPITPPTTPPGKSGLNSTGIPAIPAVPMVPAKPTTPVRY